MEDGDLRAYLSSLRDPACLLSLAGLESLPSAPHEHLVWSNDAFQASSARLLGLLAISFTESRLGPSGGTTRLPLFNQSSVEVSILRPSDTAVCRIFGWGAPQEDILEQAIDRLPMLRLLCDFPFAATDLGDRSSWSATLKTAVLVTMSIPWPCCLCWGPGRLLKMTEMATS